MGLMGPTGKTWTTIGFNYSSSQLFIDHRHSSIQCQDHVTCGPNAVVQTAPLVGGLDGPENGVELFVLVDNGLVEAYLNRRVVMSVWVTELMNETALGHGPAQRKSTPLTPPKGVTCSFESWGLMPLPA